MPSWLRIVLWLNILYVNCDVNDNEVSEQNEHSLELTQSLNLARQELIQETCRRYPPKKGLDDLPLSQLEHILIDDEHKLLYCYVPKVACTNWKRVLMILGGKWNETDVLAIPASLAHTPGMFRNLSTVAKPERDFMLENYHKMIIARNPFERLLSAFRNKLEGATKSARYFQDRVGRRIIKAFRENPSNFSLEHGNDVTFKEFALFLTNKSKDLADVANNEHWQPITSLCHPCHIKYTLVVAIPPEPSVLWYRDDQPVDESNRCHHGKEERGVFYLDIQNLEFLDQAEWKCVAINDFGHSVTSCFLKLIIPRHYKKPRFLENLQAILSEEGAVNLECKVIGVPQPVLKWYKDGEELKPGDIHRIISGQDGTCCLGTYTCEAQNCMGIAASSASLLGFDDSMKAKKKKAEEQALQRNLSLSTIHDSLSYWVVIPLEAVARNVTLLLKSNIIVLDVSVNGEPSQVRLCERRWLAKPNLVLKVLLQGA